MSSLKGTMFISSQAMLAQTKAMETISENIANVNTTGFKRVESPFKTLMMESDVQNDYFSATTAVRRMVSLQGNILGSNSGTDMAINGQGFFIVNTAMDGSGDTLFTRAGAFQTRASDVDGDGEDDSVLTTGDGYPIMGWEATGGVFSTGTTTSGLVPIVVRNDALNPATSTSEVTVRANIDSNAISAQSLSFAVYDSAGQSRTITALYTPTATPGEWELTFDAGTGNTVTAPGAAITVQFDGDGTMPTTPTPATVGVTFSGGETAAFTYDYEDLTQFSGETLTYSIDQDGRPPGYLQSVQINNEGVVTYSYTNGFTEARYKVALADFPAPDQLDHLSGTYFRESEGSGDVTVFEARSGNGQAAIIAGSIETSNVDLADEFTRMITTQKAYTMASTTFRTGDEMTQVARDLLR